jgi:protein-disulfide isomerase
MSSAIALLLAAAAALAPDAAPAEPADDALPGVDVSALTPAQKQVLLAVVRDEFCYCGCPHTLQGCLKEHKSCKHAPRMAALAARLAAQGLTAGEILKNLTEYYAAFDKGKRAKLDLKDFGPPLGNADGPITIVEFSDFTCPYCQALRPELERFVKENGARVRLYYKPFPLPSHARSMEAALAGEWARDKGLFWKMHDDLFSHPHQLADDDLAAAARSVGGDPDDLLQAVTSARDKARITASMAEARSAGLVGTPTLYVNGRKLGLAMAPSDAQETLRFTVEDEEEWTKQGGWAKD